jgi:hypothetical protein
MAGQLPYSPSVHVRAVFEGPLTREVSSALAMLGAEYEQCLARLRGVWSRFRYSPTSTWFCPNETLHRRVAYGGKKGRAALRRLKRRGVL